MLSYTIDPVETMNRMLDSFFEDRSVWKRPDAGPDRYPQVDMYTGKDAVLIRAEIPGVAGDNVEITVKEELLTIGLKHDTDAPEGFRGLSRERAFGETKRKIRLPYRVEAGAVEAKLSHGVLMLRLPRAESDKPVTIQINR